LLAELDSRPAPEVPALTPEVLVTRACQSYDYLNSWRDDHLSATPDSDTGLAAGIDLADHVMLTGEDAGPSTAVPVDMHCAKAVGEPYRSAIARRAALDDVSKRVAVC
jgi:hypothetical protein